MNVFASLINDERGFIVSAELVLVATITVLGLIVGLTEVAFAVNRELNDVGAAFGSINQSYCFRGATGQKGQASGSMFQDHADQCDSENDVNCNSAPQPEA